MFTLLLSWVLPGSDVALFDLCSDLIGSDVVIQSISRCSEASGLNALDQLEEGLAFLLISWYCRAFYCPYVNCWFFFCFVFALSGARS